MLNIYSALYGRQLEQENLCPSGEQEPPPFGMFLGLSRFIFNIIYRKIRPFAVKQFTVKLVNKKPNLSGLILISLSLVIK